MNPLDIVLAGLFELLGVTHNMPPDAPKLDGSERFDAKGQTSTINKSGKTRNFQNPKTAANRPPTLDPLPQRGTLQATPPNRPAGGFGQAPGQMNLDPLREMQIPKDQMKAPNVPKPKPGKPKPQLPQYGPTSLPNQPSNRLWLTLRQMGAKGPTGGMNLPYTKGAQVPGAGKAIGVQLGILGLNRLLANIPGIDGELKQRLDQAIVDSFTKDPYAELFPQQQQQQAQPAKPQQAAPKQEQVLDTPELRSQQAAELLTPIQQPIPANPSEAPVRAGRNSIRPYPNVGAEQVSPGNRGTLRPNPFY